MIGFLPDNKKENSDSPKDRSQSRKKPGHFLFNLKAFHKASDHALSDLLPYGISPEPGYIVNKDGSYMVTWEYEAGDEQSKTLLDRDQQVKYINDALISLEAGWMYHINCIRRTVNVFPDAERNYFSNDITEIIEEERRAYFNSEGNSFETIFYFTLTYLPTKTETGKADKFFFDVSGEGGGSKKEKKQFAEILFETFKKKAQEVEDVLSVALRLRKLTKKEHINHKLNISYETDEHLNFLNECVTGDCQEMQIPYPMSFLDAHIGKATMATGVIPKVGDKFLSIINIDGFPNFTYAGLFNQITEIGFEFRWCTRFIPMSRWEAEKQIKKYAGGWHRKAVGFLNFYQQKEPEKRDEMAEMMDNDARSANVLNKSGNSTFGFYTGCVVIFGDTLEEIEQKTSIMRQAFMALGITNARHEQINAVEAYLGSLPGNGFANVRRPILHTENISDIIPTSSSFLGESSCPNDKYPPNSPPLSVLGTEGNTPFRLNLHVGDVGHTLIFGPTGSGKSVLLAFLTTQIDRYPDVTIYAFDKGMSLFPVCMAMNGNHYEVGVESEMSTQFSPLSRLGSQDDVEWAIDWIENLMRLQNIEPNLSHKNAIREAIMETVYAQEHPQSPGIEHRLSEFAVTVQDADVKKVLDFYTTLDYYNAAEDGLRSGGFQCFEIEELMNLPDSKSLPIMLYIFRVIERSLKGRPTFVIIDEAWIVLGHEVFRDKVREWLKVLRKANCAVILATQSITDAERSGIMDVLNESCPTKIFLPNPAAKTDEFAPQYTQLGLNAAQRNIIANAIPKREYFINTRLGDRKVNLALGPVELAFCAKSSKDDIRDIKHFISNYGKENWAMEWLRNCVQY